METQDPTIAPEDTETAKESHDPQATPQAASGDTPETASEAQPSSDEEGLTIEGLEPGMELRGRVRNIVDFGAFVDIGVGRDGLAHISTLRRAGIDKTIQVGDELDVVVRRVKKDDNRISLTIPDAIAGNRKSLEEIEAGTTVKGRVVRIVDFGAFVDIGAQTDGLVHISEFSQGFVENPKEAVSVGQEVEVRVLEVDTDRRRISLSMKGTGQVEASPPREDRPKRGGRRRRPIQEEMPDQSDVEIESPIKIAFQQALAERRRRERH
jgi:transcriptional accessory protein Tex/SPT6